ncbi:MAG: hypothetical protein H6658_02165 [Ardenticatenaceae bacterium]|nr:hypothetical protein [Ardenticatenaceae bacterium]
MPTHRVLLHQNGPALWPEHKPLAEVLELKETTPELIWHGTYQGSPTPPGGYTFKRAWWPRKHRYALGQQHIHARFLSFDTGLKDKETADFTACTVGELWPDYRLGLAYAEQARYEFPFLPEYIEQTAVRWNYDGRLNAVIIEDKASGISALQTLQASSPAWLADMLVAFNPTTDKVTRASQAAVWCKNHSVLLPVLQPDLHWLIDFEDELFDFPQAVHDHRTDAFSQMILYLENLLSAGWQARGGDNQ